MYIPYNQHFCEVQNFALFEGRAVNAKNKTGRNSYARYFTAELLVGVFSWHLNAHITTAKSYFLWRALEPNRENLHLQKCSYYTVIINVNWMEQRYM